MSALAGCDEGNVTRAARDAAAPVPASQIAYQGVETRLLDGDLVEFRVGLSGTADADAVNRYAECAAAQYALIRGYGFARHLRTNVNETNGAWRAEAIYTISASLPQGLKTIDAEVVTSHCAENGIPTV